MMTRRQAIKTTALAGAAFATLPGLRAGTMPEPAALQKAVDAAYAKFKDEKGGANASYIPYLA